MFATIWMRASRDAVESSSDMGIVLITGGARSGKSAMAERLCREMTGRVAYIATAAETDDDMADRIAHHRARRPQEWATIEKKFGLAALADDEKWRGADVLLLDCVTTLITNHMMESGLDFTHCGMDDVQQLEDCIRTDIDGLLAAADGKELVIVTNEVGQGVVPAYRMGRIFVDISGRINAHIAGCADAVYLMAAGLSLRLK